MGKIIKGALPGFIVQLIGVAMFWTPLAPFAVNVILLGQGMMVAGALAGAASYFVKKPSMNMGATQDRLHISVDPTAIGKWIIGETTCATDIVYAEQHGAGSNQGNITYVIAAAAHTI